MSASDLPVRIINPRRLPAWELPVQRIPLGIPGDYKPSMALMPDGELVIEGKTPWGMASGGGFGNTVQLADGSLVSCYTYATLPRRSGLRSTSRGADNQTHLEVARWSLP